MELEAALAHAEANGVPVSELDHGREKLEALRNRSTGFAATQVPETTFNNVRDVTRGQTSSQSRFDVHAALLRAAMSDAKGQTTSAPSALDA